MHHISDSLKIEKERNLCDSQSFGYTFMHEDDDF